MRGFMRAIGLGGLLRRSRTSSGSVRNSVLRPIANPFIAVLEEKRVTSPTASGANHAQAVFIEPVRESRSSSMLERPQFLFFCGSESTGSATSRPPSWTSARVNATIQDRQSEYHAPPTHISHRMPVFFAAHGAFPTVSPTSTGARMSTSIFN